VSGAKYEFTGETTQRLGVTFQRIRAVRDIPRWVVKAGDVGGWIESGELLAQSGNAWVSGDASVSGNATVYGDARVYGNARVSGNASWLAVGPVGSEHRTVTITHTPHGPRIHAGCWTGTADELRERVAEPSQRWPAARKKDRKRWARQYRAIADLADLIPGGES
jgi:hypothetical protein